MRENRKRTNITNKNLHIGILHFHLISLLLEIYISQSEHTEMLKFVILILDFIYYLHCWIYFGKNNISG